MTNDQVNQELLAARRLSEQQLMTFNSKNQDTLSKFTLESDRIRRRLNEYERFIHVSIEVELHAMKIAFVSS